MNKYINTLTTLFLFASLNSFASSDDKVVRIAAGEWPPFIGQQLEGFGHVGQTIEKVFSAQGYQVEFHFFPWKRAYKKASEGKFVATAVWMYAEEREELFWFSDPVAQEQFVFFHLRDTPFEWTNLDALKGKLLGGGLGYSYGAQLDALLENGEIEMNRVEDPLKAFQLLRYRRVELVPEEKHIGMFSLNKLPIETQSQITFHPKPFLSNDSFLMFSKAHPQAQELMEIFNQGLKQLKASESKY